MSAKSPGRPRQTTHDDIRAVAFALFAEKGYARTSLAEIARASGVSRTTLFAYFPAKRDLMWEEFDAGAERMRRTLDASRDLPVMDAIVAALLAVAHYGPADHASFVERRRIVYSDDGLRAAAALRADELSEVVVEQVRRRAPDADPERVGDVVHALMAVGERGTADWAHLPQATEALDTHLATRLQPFVDALRPLLD
ncbi:TetR/AcrR family transcriptional regulator [Microbacterium lushaniae]|uniref:TetR family transcriptional regulator n=1 Tax=Microbacterium lushaniae TaxID=2614639 RepID=A0A5J6L1E4_9MICO|nr:TetR/AcrR family transcriptional regulator [Microbacterium lushaniae]QEW02287.1 TetR family transcriptional regulator [Microbacterium lushaniae]